MKYVIASGTDYINLEKQSGVCYMDRRCRHRYTIPEATKFKYETAVNYLSKLSSDGLDWGIRRVSSSEKPYVITTCHSFVANLDGDITKHQKDAWLFDTVSEAQAFLFNYPKIFKTPKILTETLGSVAIPAHSDVRVDKRIIIPRSTRIEVYNRDHGICGICGGPVDPENITVDHIVPLSRGGKNEMDNYQLACDKCNKLKSNYKDEELARGMTYILANQLETRKNEELSDILIRSIVRGKLNSIMKGTVYERI